jgi:hypothetical protein
VSTTEGFYVVSSLLCFLLAVQCLNLTAPSGRTRDLLRGAAVGGFVVFLVSAVVFAFGPVTGWPS